MISQYILKMFSQYILKMFPQKWIYIYLFFKIKNYYFFKIQAHSRKFYNTAGESKNSPVIYSHSLDITTANSFLNVLEISHEDKDVSISI